jgi:hypothetical protein
VLHHPCRVGEVGAHCGREPGDLGSLSVAPAERGELDRTHLDGPADVEDLLDGDLVGLDDMVEHQGEHARVHRRDPRPPSVADVDQLQCRQRAERFADDGARDVELGREGVLARQHVPRPEPVRPDMRLERRSHLLHQAAGQSPFSATLQGHVDQSRLHRAIT